MPPEPRRAPPLQAAMRLLARRGHGRAELSAKLRQRGYEAAEIGAAIDRALELGVTEPDHAIAQRYARQLSEKAGATPRWVRQKLGARGFPQEAIDGGVDAAFADWDARQAALEYAGADQNLARVARRLERRGFPADVISWAVRRLRSDREES